MLKGQFGKYWTKRFTYFSIKIHRNTYTLLSSFIWNTKYGNNTNTFGNPLKYCDFWKHTFVSDPYPGQSSGSTGISVILGWHHEETHHLQCTEVCGSIFWQAFEELRLDKQLQQLWLVDNFGHHYQLKTNPSIPFVCSKVIHSLHFPTDRCCDFQICKSW